MKLWTERSDLDSLDFLLTKQRAYSFGDIFSSSDEIYKDASREIVLILCDKNIETILVNIAYLLLIIGNMDPLQGRMWPSALLKVKNGVLAS